MRTQVVVRCCVRLGHWQSWQAAKAALGDTIDQRSIEGIATRARRSVTKEEETSAMTEGKTNADGKTMTSIENGIAMAEIGIGIEMTMTTLATDIIVTAMAAIRKNAAHPTAAIAETRAAATATAMPPPLLRNAAERTGTKHHRPGLRANIGS